MLPLHASLSLTQKNDYEGLIDLPGSIRRVFSKSFRYRTLWEPVALSIVTVGIFIYFFGDKLLTEMDQDTLRNLILLKYRQEEGMISVSCRSHWGNHRLNADNQAVLGGMA